MNSFGHLRIEQVRLAPAQEWMDSSAAWRFLRIETGAAYWLAQDQPRALNPGEVVIAAAGVRAVIRASQLNEVVLHGFTFAPDLLCGFFTLAERHLLEHGSLSSRARFLPSTHPVSELFRELTVPSAPEHPLARRAQIVALVAAFFGDIMPSYRKPALHLTSSHERFRQVVSQMPDVELIQHSPKELADLCHCSPRHFNRLFREYFGEPPRVHRTNLRLLKASHLLVSTDDKIAEVARNTGFKSLSLFNALFKRRFGLSPSEYRARQDLEAPRTADL